jgi:hypothetical protein
LRIIGHFLQKKGRWQSISVGPAQETTSDPVFTAMPKIAQMDATGDQFFMLGT